MLSQYITVFPDDEDSDFFFLYSTKKASLVRLHKDSREAADRGMLSSGNRAVLSEMAMITDDKVAERQGMLYFLDDLTAKNDFISLTVVLNLDCNFACLYCFEESVKSPRYMSPETADMLPPFIENKLTNRKKNLKITFYGGEPLLSQGLIRHISLSVKKLVAEKTGGDYSFSMVTNGSLLTRKTAEELSVLGLKSAQITLDGPPDVHNCYRPFKSGKDSFDTLIENIKATCGIIDISIGGNYDQSSSKKFPELLDILEKEGLTPDKISGVKFDPVIHQPQTGAKGCDYDMGCKTANEPWVLEAEIPLREEILKRGYNTPKPSPICCMVDHKDAFVVNHDGEIYKCPGFIGMDGFSLGNLASGIDEAKDPYKKDIWKTPECLACKYLPQCFGGCRYMTFLRTGRINEVDCQKQAMDASLVQLIRQDMRYRGRAEG